MTTRAVRFAALALACLVLACLVGARVQDTEHPKGVTEPPAYERFIVIQLRVHVLSATDLPEVDCKLSDEDVRRIVGKVNTVVWHKAGIHFGLESIRREPAARQDEFRAWRERLGGEAPLDLYPLLRPAMEGGAGKAGIAPEKVHAFEGLHVYYVHEMPTNGVYFDRREEGGHDTGAFAFVKETASLRPVAGGIDEPVPRVTAHELGHALGLRHRQNWTNLMQSGTTGTLLSEAEVSSAREAARKLDGAGDVAAWRERAEAAQKAGDLERARQLWAWLAEVPGDGAAEAAKRRDAAKADAH